MLVRRRVGVERMPVCAAAPHGLARRLMLQAIFATPARAWVRAHLPSGAAYRWSLPASALSDDGLGGGISWAIAPSNAAFCARMLPSFSKHRDYFGVYPFTSCEDLVAALDHAFGSWSQNHRAIRFARCELTRDGGADGGCTPELLVRATSPLEDDGASNWTSSTFDQFAAYVEVGGTLGRDAWLKGPMDTAGEVHDDELILGRATVTFHSHVCFFLDSNFCAQFEREGAIFGRSVAVSTVILTALGAGWVVGLAAVLCALRAPRRTSPTSRA